MQERKLARKRLSWPDRMRELELEHVGPAGSDRLLGHGPPPAASRQCAGQRRRVRVHLQPNPAKHLSSLNPTLVITQIRHLSSLNPLYI